MVKSICACTVININSKLNVRIKEYHSHCHLARNTCQSSSVALLSQWAPPAPRRRHRRPPTSVAADTLGQGGPGDGGKGKQTADQLEHPEGANTSRSSCSCHSFLLLLGRTWRPCQRICRPSLMAANLLRTRRRYSGVKNSPTSLLWWRRDFLKPAVISSGFSSSRCDSQ